MIKTLTRLSVFIVAFLIGASKTSAQYYTGFGVHIGRFASGVSFKYFFDANNANSIEIIAGKTRMANGGYSATAYYEMQLPINNSMLQIPLDFVFGGGAHGAYYPTGYYYVEDGKAHMYADKTYSVGIDAVLGLEYKVPVAPLTFGVSVTPFYEFINPGPEFIDFSLTIRYVFD
jgi:hypothetical protein